MSVIGPKIEVSFRMEDGEFGSKRLIQYGRCPGDAATVDLIMQNCTRRFQLVPLPQASGVVLKPLDGTSATVVDVKPPTIGRTFKCVKVDARVNPLAPKQDGGFFQGLTVLEYEVVWQQVGSLS